MRLTVRGHVLETIAVDAPAIEPFVNIVHHWNAIVRVAIILREHAITDRLHQLSFFWRKEANRRHMLNALQYNLACGLIPEGLLAQCLEALIIAWLSVWRYWLTCLRVYR